ncbi:MAG: translocation/assembly module TamB domain-containing protein, partial [Thermoanaerobaculales bacterium]|nr:translocation/assembly module TamB domain-containing protein [Thermoanaerobaculales bacterium]
MGRRRLRPLQFLWRRVAFVLALPVVVPAAVLLAANTVVGHQLIGSAVERLSSGRVRLEGLGGVLPHRPLATLLELRDDEGPWLRVEDAALDLEPLALLRGEIVVRSLSGRSVQLLRRPASPEPAAEPIRPPWPLRLDRLRVDRLALGALVPGAPELVLDGNAVADGDGRVRATVEAGAIGRADAYRLDLSSDEAEHRFDLEVLESSGGLLNGLAARHGWHPPPALGPDIRLAASVRRAGDAWHVDSARIDTTAGTLQAQGSVAADALALGWTLDLRDIGLLLPGALGAVRVGGEIAGPPGAPRVAATLASIGGLTLPGAVHVAEVSVGARLSDLLGAVDVDASATLTGLAVAGVAGDLALTARGQLAAMALTAETSLRAGGEPVPIGLSGRLDAFGKILVLERLEGRARGEVVRLLAPATLDLSDGVEVDRLRLGLRQGAIEISGRLAPALALDATFTGLPADLLRLVVPGPGLSGTFGAEARLTGSAGSLTGSVRARGDGLRLTEGPGRGLPPASIELTARLGADGAEIESRFGAGKGARFGLSGRIGGGAATGLGALDLRADGRLDLALLDPLLTGSGRRARGKADLEARVTGTFGAPRVDGALRVAEGAFWDRSLGLVLTDVKGSVGLAGETLRAERLTARAGPGTLALEGTVGLLAPAVPVDLRLTARDARPLQRDELDLQGDGELRLTGSAAEGLTVAGSVRLDGVEIRLPDRLPAAIATLEVRETGERRAQPPGARRATLRRGDVRVDVVLSAPGGLAVRGRGIDAELGGEVHLQGPLDAPAATGGFDLLRGQFTLVGQPLRFSRGRIGFDGGAVLDPTLDLEARTTAGGGTAILAVSGTVAAPRVALRGEPEMPQDEVLSRLLFGVAGGRLSPWQATRLGLAAASLAGERA